VSNNVVAILYIKFGKGVTRVSNKGFGLVYTKPETYMARNLTLVVLWVRELGVGCTADLQVGEEMKQLTGRRSRYSGRETLH
jgi:hypothetical protein